VDGVFHVGWIFSPRHAIPTAAVIQEVRPVSNVGDDTLLRLSEVQSRDLELDSLGHEKEQTPPELITSRSSREALLVQLDAERAELDEKRQKLNSTDLELGVFGERRKAAADAALRAESSKEASQFQNQELQLGNRIQELEEDMLPLLEKIEKLENDISGLEGQLAVLEPEIEQLTATEEARVKSLDERIVAITAEREALAADIAPQLLRLYEQIRKARRGTGLVEIADNARCTGCNVHLPINVVQKARKGGATVTRCPSCGRILWPR
jgi:predicted  nucleic acid-binding Zn-ribbon protein